MTNKLRITTILAALCACTATLGHEFWVEPDNYTPAPKGLVKLSTSLGERFAGEPMRFDPEHFSRLEVLGPDGATKIAGRSGTFTTFARVGGPGTYVLVEHSRPMKHEMAPAAFEKYLDEEGLGDIVKQRAARNEQTTAGRESFERCAKSIVVVAGDANAPIDRVARLPLEIVLEARPTASAKTSSGSCRVLFRDKPLAGATIAVVSKLQPTAIQRVTTDAEGRAVFSIDHAGPCMLTTIHMVRAETGADVDWRSYWASITFDVSAAASAAADAR